MNQLRRLNLPGRRRSELRCLRGIMLRRRGVTLSEVLVSMLVLSIGVVSVAALFPIAVLRSVQATQLTNATNLKYNAENLVRVIPQLITLAPEWKPAIAYNAGDAVVPTATTRLRLPPSVFICTVAGTSNGFEPVWGNANRDGDTLTDGGVTWAILRLRNYIVDPLGALQIDGGDASGAFRSFQGAIDGATQHFGNVGGTPVTPLSQFVNRFPGVNGLTQAQAVQLSALPDSWVELAVAEQPFSAAALTTLTLDSLTEDLSTVIPAASLTSGETRVRAVFQDATRSITEVRNLTAATGQTITWGGNLDLAAKFPAATNPLASVRLELYERRYSYMLSVRRGLGGSAHLDCVIFFRRRVSTNEEQAFNARFVKEFGTGADTQPGVATIDDDRDGTVDNARELGWPGSDDRPRNYVILQYDSNGPEPFFRKGSHICDAINLRWYRVIDTATSGTIGALNVAGFSADTAVAGANEFVRLTLETPVEQNSTNVNSGVLGGAVLMRGVVDVFPLQPLIEWEN